MPKGATAVVIESISKDMDYGEPMTLEAYQKKVETFSPYEELMAKRES